MSQVAGPLALVRAARPGPAGSSRVGRPGYRCGAVLAVGWVAGLVVVTRVVPATQVRHWLGASSFAADVVTVAVCGWAGLRARSAQRRWRLFLAAAAVSLAVNAYYTTWLPTGRGEVRDAVSVTTIIPLIAPLLVIPALLLFPSAPSRGRAAAGAVGAGSGLGWYRTVLLDGFIVVGSLLLLAWHDLLGPVFRAKQGSAGWALNFAAVFLLVLLVVLVVVIGVFREPSNQRAWALLGGGLTVFVAASGVIVYLSATGSYQIPALYPTGYTIGPLLLAFAAVTAQRATPRVRSPQARQLAIWAHSFLPYPFLVAVGILLVVHRARGSNFDRFDLVIGPALVALVVLRQLLTVADNTRLVFQVQAGEQELRQQAFHDSLTGLANRALFRDRLEHAVAMHRREMRPLALLFLDLDNFKGVNDRLGHAAGDELLRGVAARLQRATREGDTVARLGGDEFGILLEGDRVDPVRLGERLVEMLHVPYRLTDAVYATGASVGLVVAAPGQLDPDTLLRQADLAMYAAKARGKGTLVCYRPELAGAGGGPDLSTGLALALAGDPAGGELGVAYQPIVTLADGRTRAVEALARWTHPTQGAMSPTLFVPAAEQAGLIGALDTFVLDRACADIARIRAAGGAAPVVHVNVSATRVGDDTFPGTVEAALRRYRLPATAVIVEITETGQIPDLAGAARALTRLADRGVRIALDDIGTGRTAVAALHLLPVHIIKLDRSLIAATADSRTTALRTGLVTLAHSLGMLVVAEGIETAGERDAAVAAGCELGQGFWFSLPGALVAADPAAAVAPERRIGPADRRVG